MLGSVGESPWIAIGRIRVVAGAKYEVAAKKKAREVSKAGNEVDCLLVQKHMSHALVGGPAVSVQHSQPHGRDSHPLWGRKAMNQRG